MEELLELALAKIKDIEKRLEIYFSLASGYDLIKNMDELHFLMSGKYFFESDIDNIINGTY
ncbi:MAG: hypothetical protein E7374_01680 [Clostridiales bacterium]|nr:hypothetical protein [Clostridiales bacterium]